MKEIKHALFGIHHIAWFGVNAVSERVGRRLRPHRRTLPQVFRMFVMAEQLPNPESRVELSGARDSLGVPIARLNWRLTDQDLDSFERSQEAFAQGLLAAGHRRVDPLVKGTSLPPGLSGGYHHMGTTRMGASPRHGVVDRNCQMHGVNNLYVAGPSVFPTGGYASPALTIMALALRLAEHCKARLH